MIEISKPSINKLAETLGERVELNAISNWKQSILYFSPGKRSYFNHYSQSASYPLPLTSSVRFLINGIEEEIVLSSIPGKDYFRDGERVMIFEPSKDRFIEALRPNVKDVPNKFTN